MVKKTFKIAFIIYIIIGFILHYSIVNAAPTYTGATTISKDKNEYEIEYSSTNSNENALLINGGKSSLEEITVTKSGDANGEDADFYGTNAAVLVTDEAKVEIDEGTINTAGKYANGAFAYGTGEITISNVKIETSNDNSGAIMVAGGGKIVAEDIRAVTNGNSSAPIRSDRGGGTIEVTDGSYTSNGSGSPAIYSTADIKVMGAKLVSNASEGIIVEGKNSVSLEDVVLEDTNTKLHGNSETYKNIFLYQSMSGDAKEGTANFSAEASNITTNKGDTFFVTNTTAKISLTDNKFTNNDNEGAFLRIQKGKWGKSGANGGNVTLETLEQKVEGNIYVDDISTLTWNMADGSSFKGTINGENTAKNIAIKMDDTCKIELTGDTYITSLENEAEENSNINLNGYTLYVNGTAITETGYKEPKKVDIKTIENSSLTLSPTTTSTIKPDENTTITDGGSFPFILVIVIIVVVVAFIIFFAKLGGKKKN